MANPKVQVDIVAENVQLKAKLAETEALLARSGQKGGKEAAAGFEGATKSVGAFGKAMRLLSFPAIVITSAWQISKYLTDAANRAEDFRAKLADIGKEFHAGAVTGALQLRVGDVQIDKIKARQTAQQLESTIQQEIFSTYVSGSIVNKLAPVWLSKLLGMDDASIKRMVKDASDRLKGVKGDLQTTIANIDQQAGRQRLDRQTALEIEAALDERVKTEIVFQQRRLEVEREFGSEGTKASAAEYQARMDLLNKIEKQAMDKIAAARSKQLRDYLDEIKKAQSEGFLPKDVNVSALGGDSTLAFFRNQLPAIVSFGSGGW